MQIGISTACLYPQPLEESFQELTDLGFRSFEIFFNTYAETQPDFLGKLEEIRKRTGSRICSVHPFTSAFEGTLFFSEYERRFWDGLSFYDIYLKAARFLGASILVLHGQRNYRNSAISEGEYIKRYSILYERGRQQGILVAQENVNAFRSEDPAFIRRMRQELGENCAFVLDCKQAVRAGFDPYEMCQAMGRQLVHVHMNDHTLQKDCLLPGQGTMEYRRLFSILRENGYKGSLVLEVYRKDFRELSELLQSQKVLRHILTNFN